MERKLSYAPLKHKKLSNDSYSNNLRHVTPLGTMHCPASNSHLRSCEMFPGKKLVLYLVESDFRFKKYTFYHSIPSMNPRTEGNESFIDATRLPLFISPTHHNQRFQAPIQSNISCNGDYQIIQHIIASRSP